MARHDDLKEQVHNFWNAQSCGESYAILENHVDLERQAAERYRLEPYLEPFARFEEGNGLDVLEIGVGMSADHLRWARSGPRRLCGIDLTERAIQFTRQRLTSHGLASELQEADAENLPFENAIFDLVYSWGVLHHSPDTQRAFNEVARVLKRGGQGVSRTPMLLAL